LNEWGWTPRTWLNMDKREKALIIAGIRWHAEQEKKAEKEAEKKAKVRRKR